MEADLSLIWLQAGYELSGDQAGDLLKRLEVDPNDFEARAKMLGYAQRSLHWESRDSDLLREQLLWCIENQPAADLHTSGSLHPDSSAALRAEVCSL